ncbi:MAG: AEC family transporter [Verrucomicrobiota bacterium]
MSQTTTILNAVVPVFGVMALGLVIRRLNWLTEEADKSLMRICVNLLLPCLILDKSLGNPALSQVSNLLLAPLVGYLIVALGMWIAWLAQPLHGLREPAERRTFAVAVGMHNYGYVPLPLALLLFDQKTAGVLFLHIIGVEMAMWTLGVMVLSGGAARDWRKLLNAPLFAIVFAIIINALGWDAHEPQVVSTSIHWLGGCAIPLALILIGAIMADHIGDFHSARGWRVMGVGVLLRIGLLPLAFLLVAKFDSDDNRASTGVGIGSRHAHSGFPCGAIQTLQGRSRHGDARRAEHGGHFTRDDSVVAQIWNEVCFVTRRLWRQSLYDEKTTNDTFAWGCHQCDRTNQYLVGESWLCFRCSRQMVS